MPGHANIHHLYHDHYIRGGSIRAWANQLHLNARLMLQRTAILPSLSRAQLLLDVLDRFAPPEHFSDESEQSRFFGIFALLTECYEVIADDLLVLSSLELHAKATLLKGGYVIHQIRKPAKLKQLQETDPVHVRRVRARAKNGDEIVFGQKTIGIATWLKPAYMKRYPLPAGAAAAVDEVRRRRNFVHFMEPYTWTVDRNLLDLVSHLDQVIPRMRMRGKRRQARRGA